MAPKSGLVVTVTPGASAFFAGEVFTATITFANAHPPANPDSASLSHHNQYQSSVANLSSASTPNLHGPAGRQRRPPSASQLPLADYATAHINSDAVPPSPAFGSTSGQWGRTVSAASSVASDASNATTRPTHSRRPSFARTPSNTSLVEPATPKAGFGSFGFGSAPPAPPSPPFTLNRSASNISGPPTTSSDPSKPALPTRKGLIGKPLPPAPSIVSIVERKQVGGLYGAQPRWPGSGPSAMTSAPATAPPVRPGGHGRSQSMAVGKPGVPLLNGHGNGHAHGGPDRSVSAGHLQTVGIHGRSRLGGSIGGADLTGPGLVEQNRNGRDVPAAIGESEQMSSSNYDDAAFPPSNSMSSHDPHMQRPSAGSQLSSAPARQDPDHSDSGSDYDPADGQAPLPGQGFYGLGKNETMDSVAQLDYEARRRADSWTTSAEQPLLSRNASISGVARQPALHPPNTIALLWSFAHLEGMFEVDEALIQTTEFLRLKRELVGGLTGVGGGTLDDKRSQSIRTDNSAASGRRSGGWTSWIWGGSKGPTPTRDDVAGAASLEERRELSLKEKNIPTFSSPPSILGVDLVLEPGETKTYTFNIRIPADLPPSFRGKAIKFSYHLVVGTSRTLIGGVNSPHQARGTAQNATNRVMRVPVRVYNHVGVTGARPFYDLTNPIVYHRDEATVAEGGELESSGTVKVMAKKRNRKTSNDRQIFEEYAANLLDQVVQSSPELTAKVSMSPELGPMRSPTILNSEPARRPERMSRSGAPLGGNDDEDRAGCKSAVEIVTRNSQKVSYDINKDGYLVASLTLVKSAYRLGETVNGSVVINSGDGRVLRVSARLETHELIETTISTRPAPQVRQITRRLHAEHHETTLDSARVGFALAIPSGATPDFGTSGVKLQWSVRLLFLVIPPSPDAPAPNPNLTERKPLTRGNPPGKGPAPAGRSHGRSKSFAYGFEPAVPLTLPAPPMIPPSGAAHLMPSARDASLSHSTYRAVPDLGFVPVLFTSAAPEPPPPPGPLQRSASGASLHRSSGSLSLSRPQSPQQQGSVVLVPAKVDTVECSIPIKVYPGNTPFRPTLSVFAA